MDPERQIRFLYPPLFLIASVLWGLKIDTATSIGDIVPLALFKEPGTSIVTVVAGGGVLVVALGLLIGSISLVLLRSIVSLWNRQSHEAVLSPTALDTIQLILGYRDVRTPRDVLFLAATFDHDRLPKPIHTWLLRRWNAFNISSSSIVALGLALLVGGRLGIQVGSEWFWTSLVFGTVFGATAVWAWRDTMGMIEFQARRLAAEAGSKPE